MKNERIACCLIFAALALLLAGCAVSNAPRGSLPEPADRISMTRGGWISVESASANIPVTIEGELLAVGEENLFILTEFGKLQKIPLNDIISARMTAYDIKSGELTAWTVLGVISTASHGLFLILTAPAWILIGGIPTAVQSYKPVIKYPPRSWDEFRVFARFPQGMPEDFERKLMHTGRGSSGL